MNAFVASFAPVLAARHPMTAVALPAQRGNVLKRFFAALLRSLAALAA